jgi:hypothetical protein
MSAKELTYFILKCIDCNRIDDFFNSENYNSELDGYSIEGAFVSRVYLEAVKENLVVPTSKGIPGIPLFPVLMQWFVKNFGLPENFSHCREKPETHL